jgi:hypothetical protein
MLRAGRGDDRERTVLAPPELDRFLHFFWPVTSKYLLFHTGMSLPYLTRGIDQLDCKDPAADNRIA